MTILDSVTATDAAIALDERFVAHNYSPLPVVAGSAEGDRETVDASLAEQDDESSDDRRQ